MVARPRRLGARAARRSFRLTHPRGVARDPSRQLHIGMVVAIIVAAITIVSAIGVLALLLWGAWKDGHR